MFYDIDTRRFGLLLDYLLEKWNGRVIGNQKHKPQRRLATMVKCNTCKSLIARQVIMPTKPPKCDDCRKEDNRVRALQYAKEHRK